MRGYKEQSRKARGLKRTISSRLGLTVTTCIAEENMETKAH
jgi:hypothetical protein